MTSNDFVFWLRGYLDRCSDALDDKELEEVKSKLKLVSTFTTVTSSPFNMPILTSGASVGDICQTN